MKRLAVGCLLALVVLLPAQAQERAFDHPYYPLQVGHRWIYRSGKERVIIHVERGERLTFQPAVEGKDKEKDKEKAKEESVVGFVLKVESGGKTMTEKVGVLKDGAYRFAAAGKDITPPLRFFKLPLKPGESWEVNSTSENKVIQGTFVGGEDTLKIRLLGKDVELQTITVTSKDLRIGDEPMELKYWFAENYGMVKQQVQVKSFQVTLELEDFRPAK